MQVKHESEIEQLRSKAARHEESARILRGAMSPTPSPDDFEQAERIEADSNRAKDSGALADYLVDQKTKALERYFQEQTGCTVFHQWGIDLHCHRFYFRQEQAAGWRYILDVDQDLAPYEILSSIGAGGMGEVYRARDTRLDRVVAIKVLPPHLADRSELRERFEREARTIASLNHPRICTLFDIGQQDGVDYLVMEYLEGSNDFSGVQVVLGACISGFPFMAAPQVGGPK